MAAESLTLLSHWLNQKKRNKKGLLRVLSVEKQAIVRLIIQSVHPKKEKTTNLRLSTEPGREGGLSRGTL